MFWIKRDVEKESDEKSKFKLIYNGVSLEEIINSVTKRNNIYLYFLHRNENEKSDIYKNILKNIYISDQGKQTISFNYVKSLPVNNKEYVIIHKEDYDEYLKFKDNQKKVKAVSIENQKKIIEENKNGISQRAIAKKFGISIGTCNKIINGKY